MIPVPDALLDFIKTGKQFIVAGHKEPDGDCVGSQLALVSALKRLGKEAVPCSAGPFKRTEVKAYEKYFASSIGETCRADARVIITDCSSVDRTGDLAPLLKGLPAAVIDHHKAGKRGVEGGEAFIDEKAPSVTVMISALIEALGLELLKDEAELLLFGLCTDTGFFRHIDETGAETFEAAAKMIRSGASPKEIFQKIHGGKSLDSRILMGRILSRGESYFGGKLVISTEEYEETRRFGLESRDSDAVYQNFQAVKGVEAVVLIRQEKPDNCTAGLRSRDEVDVAAVARSFGGGGHKNAAGFSLEGTISEIKPKLLDEFKTIFS
ncbi:MAG: bifunctional oligoribonuclease/PAP phosphatase NrnA [Treponema sp.]|jgi:phosphoesterase RecJ-like protein|nr:bifunctional oligoribonuclease/PAP phosphatase NrnA [Treponema sp.]